MAVGPGQRSATATMLRRVYFHRVPPASAADIEHGVKESSSAQTGHSDRVKTELYLARATRAGRRIAPLNHSRDKAGALLHDMRQFVRKQPFPGFRPRRVLAGCKHDMLSDSVGESVHGSGGDHHLLGPAAVHRSGVT